MCSRCQSSHSKNDENVAPRNYGCNRIVHASDDPVTASRQSFAPVHGESYVAKTPTSSSPSLVAYQRTPSLITSAGSLRTLLAERGRREREIKKAVAALAKLDDRTLQDIGIPQRSQIKQVVRYCRDC